MMCRIVARVLKLISCKIILVILRKQVSFRHFYRTHAILLSVILMVNMLYLMKSKKITLVSLLKISKLNIKSLLELGRLIQQIDGSFGTVEAYIKRVYARHMTTPLGKYRRIVCDVRRTRRHIVK